MAGDGGDLVCGATGVSEGRGSELAQTVDVEIGGEAKALQPCIHKLRQVARLERLAGAADEYVSG